MDHFHQPRKSISPNNSKLKEKKADSKLSSNSSPETSIPHIGKKSPEFNESQSSINGNGKTGNSSRKLKLHILAYSSAVV